LAIEQRTAAASEYERHLEALRRREWRLEDVPFYEPGRATDFSDVAQMDYQDIYPEVWGRRCGENGIGRLREVAISVITDAELAAYDERYPFHEDLEWLESHGLQRADIGKTQEEQEQYAEALAGAGVTVHWIDWGEAPMSAFGPMQAMWAPSDLWVIRGGSVIQKTRWHPFSFGRSEFLARWAQHHLGVPILYTIVGKAVQEPATTMWFADDVWGNRHLGRLQRGRQPPNRAGRTPLCRRHRPRGAHDLPLNRPLRGSRKRSLRTPYERDLPARHQQGLALPVGRRCRYPRVAQAQGLQGGGGGPRGADSLHAHQHDPVAAGRGVHGQRKPSEPSLWCARRASR
jgi:hypothetical protein